MEESHFHELVEVRREFLENASIVDEKRFSQIEKELMEAKFCSHTLKQNQAD
jgi:ribosomal protein S25